MVARRAKAEADEALSNPVDPPDALEFRVLRFDHTAMYDGPSTAIAAVPKGLASWQRLPLVILLPGGHHNMQPHDHGCWGWWSEYRVGDADKALRRGSVTSRDYQFLVQRGELEETNRLLAFTPYRGAVIVTPWVVGRQLQPAPHGHMVASFLRDVVARAREELPVIPTRQATGLGGMSSGGLHTIFAGSVCADLFSTLFAAQPFTEDLVKPLRAIVRARYANGPPQRLRMVTSFADHQRESTLALAAALREDGVPLEVHEYPGAHSAAFAQGPGSIDGLLMFDRALRAETPEGTHSLPSHDGAQSNVFFADESTRAAAPSAIATSYKSADAIAAWSGVAAATAGASFVRSRARSGVSKQD
ncbi:MAG: hypothetical protein NVSMB1_07640 [Polyangiales bacterium]